MVVRDKVIYQTKVLEVGSEAQAFNAIKMVILFGENAPDALRSSCYLIEVAALNEPIQQGMKVVIDDQFYQITAVGAEAQTNLKNLGHVVLKFDGSTVAKLPGTIYLVDAQYPLIREGSIIRIER